MPGGGAVRSARGGGGRRELQKFTSTLFCWERNDLLSSHSLSALAVWPGNSTPAGSPLLFAPHTSLVFSNAFCRWTRFNCRFPELSLRKVNLVPDHRVKGLNFTQVRKYFSILGQGIAKVEQENKKQITPNLLWNMDECGVQLFDTFRRFIDRYSSRCIGFLTCSWFRKGCCHYSCYDCR